MKNENILFYYKQYYNKYFKYILKHPYVNLYRGLQNSNLTLNDYLNEEKFIPALELTPIPTIHRKYLKSRDEKINLVSATRSAVAMRKIEYTTNLKGFNPNRYPVHLVIKIQNCWRLHLDKLNEKAEIIQAVFFGYLMRKYLREIKSEFEGRIRGFALLRIVMIKHFLQNKRLRQHKPRLKLSLYSKNTRSKYLYQIIQLQQAYKRHLKLKSMPLKPILTLHRFQKIGTCKLRCIKKLQAKVKWRISSLKGRKKILNNISGIKITRPIMKIIFIQKFIRYILSKKRPRKRINKSMLKSFYFFTKENISSSSDRMKHKNESPVRSKYKSIRYHRKSSQKYCTKTIKRISGIIKIQKAFKKYIEKEILCPSKSQAICFFTKRNIYAEYYSPIKLIQRQIRYLLFRLNSKCRVIYKVHVAPMKYTKNVISKKKKIFNKAISVRLDFDKELMNFLVTLHVILRRNYGSKFFQMLSIDKPRKIPQLKAYSKQKTENFEYNNYEDPLSIIKVKNYQDRVHSIELNSSKSNKLQTSIIVEDQSFSIKRNTKRARVSIADYMPKKGIQANENEICLMRDLDNKDILND